MKFVIKYSKGKEKEYYFVLEARNGEVVCTSEMYKSKQGCKKGIAAVRKSLFAGLLDLTI